MEQTPFLTIPLDLGLTRAEREAGARLVPVPLGQEAGPHGDLEDISEIATDAITMSRQLNRMADLIERNARDYVAQSRLIATRLEAIARASAGPRFSLADLTEPAVPRLRAINHGSHTLNNLYGTEATEAGDTFMPDDLTYGPAISDGVIPVPGSQAERDDLLPTLPGRPDGTIFAYDGSPISTETAAKFWRRVIRTPDHWIWRGARSSKTGRPMVRMGARMWYSHRIAYTLHTRRDIAGQYLKLTCAELLCVRPSHHVLGSPGDARVTDGNGSSLVPHVPDTLTAPGSGATTDVPHAASVFQVRALAVHAYKGADGHQKYCRMGHAMSLQPSGRPTCRPCDRERQAASYLRKQGASRDVRETRQASRELGQALLSTLQDSERSAAPQNEPGVLYDLFDAPKTDYTPAQLAAMSLTELASLPD